MGAPDEQPREDEEPPEALTPRGEARGFAALREAVAERFGFRVVRTINRYEILASRALWEALRKFDSPDGGENPIDAEQRPVGVEGGSNGGPPPGYARGLTESIKARMPGSKADRDSSRGSAQDVRPEMAKTVVLHLRKQHYLRRRARLQGLCNLFAGTAFGCLLATPALAALYAESAQPAGLVGAYAVIFFLALVVARQRFRELDDEVVQIDQELDRIKVILQDRQRRALKLFQNHSLELRRYYGQVLRHASFIFWVGVACIAVGFAVVGATLWLLVDADRPASVNQWVLGGLGFAAGILANFVAMIYLRMYSTTVSSLSAFHNRLVETHRLHFANFLASHVDEELDRERALSQMAVTLAVQQTSQATNTVATTAGGGTPPGIGGDPLRRILRRRRAP